MLRHQVLVDPGSDQSSHGRVGHKDRADSLLDHRLASRWRRVMTRLKVACSSATIAAGKPPLKASKLGRMNGRAAIFEVPNSTRGATKPTEPLPPFGPT